MNKNILEGNWKQMRGRVKQLWGRLTDDDLDRIGGSIDELRGRLQERYGYAQEQAEREIREKLEQYESTAAKR